MHGAKYPPPCIAQFHALCPPPPPFHSLSCAYIYTCNTTQHSFTYCCLAEDHMPPGDQLDHIGIMGEQPPSNTSVTEKTNPMVPAPHSSLGAGLPPVPAKLVSKIESGAFIDMADLLPERLGTYCNDEEAKGKTKKPVVTNILEWLQCYSIYVAIRGQKQPERIRDLMGYQALIIDAHMEYKSNCWMGYDRRFRQICASQPGRSWAAIHPTLWNLAFAGQAKTTRCMYCFSLTHQSNDCELASSSRSQRFDLTSSTDQGTQRRQFCFQWNETQSVTCPYPNCKFQHVCYICAYDPKASDISHKAIYCPKRRGLGTSQTIPGHSSSKGYNKLKPLMPS